MITIKYKGEIVDIKDIEINWVEYNLNGVIEQTGNVEDYAQSRYSEGYNNGFENGYNEGTKNLLMKVCAQILDECDECDDCASECDDYTSE